MDSRFYDVPRFCFHVDDAAVAALTEHYGTALRQWEAPAILDICASHVSHFPSDVLCGINIPKYVPNRLVLERGECSRLPSTRVEELSSKELRGTELLILAQAISATSRATASRSA